VLCLDSIKEREKREERPLAFSTSALFVVTNRGMGGKRRGRKKKKREKITVRSKCFPPSGKGKNEEKGRKTESLCPPPLPPKLEMGTRAFSFAPARGRGGEGKKKKEGKSAADAISEIHYVQSPRWPALGF